MCVSLNGMGTQKKKKKAAFFVTNTISMVQGGNSEQGMDTNSLLRICVAEKLLNPTILSFFIYKMGVVITASSCCYYEDQNENK